MVKLIAADLDGTLLDGKGLLPEELFPVIRTLSDRGVIFAPASGRQFANLKVLFAPVMDRLVFICENGALVKRGEETLRLTPVPEEDAVRAIRAVRSVPRLHPVLCCADAAYLDDGFEPFRSLSVAAYTKCVQVEDVCRAIGREPVCKIAVYDEELSALHCMKELPEKLPSLRTALSGEHWCDISSPAANKGEAIRFLQRMFGWKREECVAFGDHMNDYEMLTECGRAYVPENGFPPLKQLIGSTVPANTEGGVLNKLFEIAEEMK